MRLTRRGFMVLAGMVGALAAMGGYLYITSMRRPRISGPRPGSSDVLLIETEDRKEGVRRLLESFDLRGFDGASIALKANFNSADPFPATTHIDTLDALVRGLKALGAKELTLAERSGMGYTRDVLEGMGVFDLSRRLGFKVVVLDDEGRDAWVKIGPDGTHWLNGFYISKVFLDADRVVQVCCLKTHRFGGHFTMSLKNSVGLVARRVPGELYDYMAELHASPYQRLMIAEINGFYNTDLVIMDAIEGFVRGGPERGELIRPRLMLASRDRVAIDAVGVAILRGYGSTKEVMKGRIFELDQIRRASELGIGVGSARGIRLVPLNDGAKRVADRLGSILREQG